MNESHTGPNKAIIVIIIVVLLGGVGAGAYYLTRTKAESADTTAQTASSNDTSTSKTSTSSSSTYKDGTYTATGSYDSPGGQEEIKVQLTLNGGTVTDATVTSLATNPTAKEYQAEFISGYKSEVVGKSINDVKLDTVGGSSLTSTGFNDAIEQIKQDAAA